MRICQLITKYLTEIGVEHQIPVEVVDKNEICAVKGLAEPYGDVDVVVAHQHEVHSLTNFASAMNYSRNFPGNNGKNEVM